MPFRFSRGLAVLIGLLVVLAAVRLPGLFSRAIWYDEAITLLGTAGHGAPELVLKGDGTLWWDGRQVTCDEELVHGLRSMFETWMDRRGWSCR